MTGFSGIAIILHRFLEIPIGISTIILNLPVAFLCYRRIGRSFLLKSFRCMLISSLFIDCVAPLFPFYEGPRLLAALVTGIVGGIGYALIYMRGSSTGGADFLIMTLKSSKPHLRLGTIAFSIDVGIILAGGLLFRDFDGIIYGMIVNYLFAVMVVSNSKQMYRILQNVTAFDTDAFINLLEAHEIHGKGFSVR